MIQCETSSERGSAAIEFAISVIVLAILIFGCVGVTMAFYTYEVVNEYARDATRFAIVHGANCNSPIKGNCALPTDTAASLPLFTYLNHQIYPGINSANLSVSATYSPGPGAVSCNAPHCNGPGDQVSVTVRYRYLYNIPFIPSRLLNMRGTSTMVISQ